MKKGSCTWRPGVALGVLLPIAALLSGCGDAVAPDPISVSVLPISLSVAAGGIKDFTATVANDASNSGVAWTLSGPGCSGAACGILSATSSPSGVAIAYTAPAITPAPASVTLTATSVTDNTKRASATVAITTTEVVSVSVTPTTANLDASTSQQFTATVFHDPGNSGVTWALSCSSQDCGTLSATSSASGVVVTYTAPALAPTPASVTLTATSVADNTKRASATVAIRPTGVLRVSITPTSAVLPPNLDVSPSQQFTATVFNDPSNSGVTWALSCSSQDCGALSTDSSASGVAVTYTAPGPFGSPPSSVTLTATSVTDNTKHALAVAIIR